MLNKSRSSGTYSEIDVSKQTIDKANFVSLQDIFTHYNIHIDNYNKKARCPFSSHKGGKEQSASFYYYPDTNSFFCFGCKSGGGSVDFVSIINNISKYRAATSILNNFDGDSFYSLSYDNYHNYDKIYLDFSHLIREFIISYKDDIDAIKYAESVCIAFDNIRNKYTLDPNGINVLFTRLKQKIEKYKLNI